MYKLNLEKNIQKNVHKSPPPTHIQIHNITLSFGGNSSEWHESILLLQSYKDIKDQYN